MSMLADTGLKALYDQRRALLAWTASLVGLVAMYAALWPSVRDQSMFNDYLDKMPAALRSLFTASGADMSTATGFVQVELFSLMAPLLLIVFGVEQHSAIAGEEGSAHPGTAAGQSGQPAQDRAGEAGRPGGGDRGAGHRNGAGPAGGRPAHRHVPAARRRARGHAAHDAARRGLRCVRAGGRCRHRPVRAQPRRPGGGCGGGLRRQRPGAGGRLAGTGAALLAVLPVRRPRSVAQRGYPGPPSRWRWAPSRR